MDIQYFETVLSKGLIEIYSYLHYALNFDKATFNVIILYGGSLIILKNSYTI